MTKEIIKEQLETIYREVFDNDEIVLKEEMTANDIEEWDSLTHLRLIMQVEKTFKVKFTTSEMKKMNNVGVLIDFVLKKIIIESES